MNKEKIKEEIWNNPVVRAVLGTFAQDSLNRGRTKTEVTDLIKQLKEEINEDFNEQAKALCAKIEYRFGKDIPEDIKKEFE